MVSVSYQHQNRTLKTNTSSFHAEDIVSKRLKCKTTKLVTHQQFTVLQRKLYECINPSPCMPILGSSNSAANKDMMSKYGQIGIQSSD